MRFFLRLLANYMDVALWKKQAEDVVYLPSISRWLLTCFKKRELRNINFRINDFFWLGKLVPFTKTFNY